MARKGLDTNHIYVIEHWWTRRLSPENFCITSSSFVKVLWLVSAKEASHSLAALLHLGVIASCHNTVLSKARVAMLRWLQLHAQQLHSIGIRSGQIPAAEGTQFAANSFDTLLDGHMTTRKRRTETGYSARGVTSTSKVKCMGMSVGIRNREFNQSRRRE